MNKKLPLMFGFTLALGGLRMLAACSDDPVASTAKDSGADTATDSPTDGSAAQKLSGKLTYTGTKTGAAVYVAVIEDLEGKGNPPITANLIAAKRVGSPTFPSSYEISPIPPGTYVVSAYLSTKTDHGQGPVFEDDPVAFLPVKVEVGAASTVLDLTLEDPPPPNVDAGDAGVRDASDAG